MKLIAQILMFVFVAFLLTPTIVCVIEKSADTSIFYGFSEEEQAHKQIKAIVHYNTSYEGINLLGPTSSLIQSENLSKHDTIASTIFIPPPEQV
ncbi:hypothetical protein ACM55F_08220 [Flavobacterium sp. XS2P12]|jgi:hypothetical protein|uniref:hypothetical protein n=1 Tax=Flavobacterium melibiosi TaxID=3398734 RepID=UPI003A87DAC1